MHCFHENTPVQYIKEAVTSEPQTESEDNQTRAVSISFSFFFFRPPSLLCTQTETHPTTAHQNRWILLQQRRYGN